jgi:hypothetical protein
MITRSVLSLDPFVFRSIVGQAGDNISIASQGDPVKFTLVNGTWTAPTSGKVFHPAEDMIALTKCTQFFTGGVVGDVDVNGNAVTKSAGDGGYYYMNKELMQVKMTSPGSIITFWHRDKVDLHNRTIHNIASGSSIVLTPSTDKKKYMIIGEGSGTIGENSISSLGNFEVNETLTFTATEDSIIMEIEI